MTVFKVSKLNLDAETNSTVTHRNAARLAETFENSIISEVSHKYLFFSQQQCYGLVPLDASASRPSARRELIKCL